MQTYIITFQSLVDSNLEVSPYAIHGEVLRLNITCPGYSGCLPSKLEEEAIKQQVHMVVSVGLNQLT